MKNRIEYLYYIFTILIFFKNPLDPNLNSSILSKVCLAKCQNKLEQTFFFESIQQIHYETRRRK